MNNISGYGKISFYLCICIILYLIYTSTKCSQKEGYDATTTDMDAIKNLSSVAKSLTTPDGSTVTIPANLIVQGNITSDKDITGKTGLYTDGSITSKSGKLNLNNWLFETSGKYTSDKNLDNKQGILSLKYKNVDELDNLVYICQDGYNSGNNSHLRSSEIGTVSTYESRSPFIVLNGNQQCYSKSGDNPNLFYVGSHESYGYRN
jgi:hypothetical protein